MIDMNGGYCNRRWQSAKTGLKTCWLNRLNNPFFPAEIAYLCPPEKRGILT